MKTVAYYRRSTKIQENSIEMQRQLARNLSYQKALIIDEEFIDDAVSGRTKSIQEREGLCSLLTKIETGEVTNVFVYKRDRLARNALDYLHIFQLLKDKQINVYFTAENEIPIQFSPAGELIELLMAGIIQREGEQIVERISETIKANFQRGKTPGNLPFGYEYEKQSKTVVRDEDRLRIVKLLFEAINSKEFTTMRQLTDYLKEKKIRRDDKNWTSQMIRSVVSNPTYMGLRLLNLSGETLKSRYDNLAIVAEKEWLVAQEVLETLTMTRKKAEKDKVHFQLINLAYCKECKTPLQSKKGIKDKKKIYYYSCKSHKINVEIEELEQKVLDSCKQFFKELLKTHLPAFHKRHNNEMTRVLQKTKDEIKQNLHKLNQRLERTTEKWLNEKRQYEKEVLEANLLNLYEQIDKQKKHIQSVEDAILEMQESVEDEISIPDTYNFKDIYPCVLFEDLVSKVEVEQNTIHIVFKHPFLTMKEVLQTRVS
ncbi:recombinase family protein [Peribacillus acanthi]|uniref:recombinase family protein n=1 Tax=Peribacillus acanthi TaxID=2171554 RepID=UPI000D3E376A|nr:recombinase family protein [Peribacillus acanthi]